MSLIIKSKTSGGAWGAGLNFLFFPIATKISDHSDTFVTSRPSYCFSHFATLRWWLELLLQVLGKLVKLLG